MPYRNVPLIYMSNKVPPPRVSAQERLCDHVPIKNPLE